MGKSKKSGDFRINKPEDVVKAMVGIRKGDTEEKEPERKTTVSKDEWEKIKKLWGNKCVLCGKTERAVGVLEKAHFKASSKGGTQVLPMCPTCHTKFDKGLATDTEFKKLNLTREEYIKMIPKPGSKKKKSKIRIIPLH